MNSKRICSSCQKPLGADAPQGLCPECLMKAGFATGEVPEPGGPTQVRTFKPPTPEQLTPLFPQLEILELLGQGGMGAVYRARQKELDRVVALKILPPDIGRDPTFAERFAREAKALAKLNHPGIVTIHEFGKADGLFYFVMEFVDGINLGELLKSSRVSPREALAIVPQICEALQFAHDQGIVHRDIKPENILMDRRGRVKVADFGLAKLVGSEATVGQAFQPAGSGDFPVASGESGNTGLESPVHRQAGKPALPRANLTDLGKVMGTPQYMAPEQAERPAEVDHRADIYALGMVFYQMLTGELPGKPMEPPSKKVQIDVRLDEVVLRALETKPELRYQQVSALKTQVEMIASSPPAAANASTPPGGQSPNHPGPDDPVERRRNRLPGYDQSKPDSAEMNQPPRFSRAAVVGAIWIGLFFLNQVVSYTPPGWAMKRWFRDGSLDLIAESLLFVPLLILGFAAVAGGSVMGVVALHHIRRARGGIRGFGLALFDVLCFPLLLLNCWAVWLAWLVASQIRSGGAAESPGSGIPWMLAAMALGGVVLNGYLIRAATQRAKQFVNSPPPPERPPITGTWGEVLRGVALRLLLAFAIQLALFETLEQLSARWKESTSEIWGMALAVATLGGLVWACWPGYRLKRSWPFCAGATIASAFLLLALDNFYSWHLRPNLGLYREPDWVAQHPDFQRRQRDRLAANLRGKPTATPAKGMLTVDSNSAEAGMTVIFDRASLRDAIQNLTRQIKWNVVFDPQLELDHSGPNGASLLQTEITLRWDKVTLEAALATLLNNYGLQMTVDPQTGIRRIAKKTAEARNHAELDTGVEQQRPVSPSNFATHATPPIRREAG